jgi:DNA-binding response OmpR family regulator
MQNKKIFIVDDDSFLLDMYALKFSQSGFDVTTALGALPALEKLRANTYVPDVILTDIVMPVVDGFEFLEKMRSEKLAPNAVRIVLSNRGQEADIARGKELGASGYIVKASTTPAEVITQVTDIITKVSGAVAAPAAVTPAA